MTTTDYTDIPGWINHIKQTEALNIKYKHLRNPETNKIYATICTISREDGVKVAVGISLCAVKDNVSRKIGRDISYNRALKALVSKKCQYPINLNNTKCEVVQLLGTHGIREAHKKFGIVTAYKSTYLLNPGD